MLILGLDAASDRKKFGYAVGTLNGSRIELIDAGLLGGPARTAELAREVGVAAKSARVLVAVDAPLGWPSAMSSVVTHRAGERIASTKDEMFRRLTDRRLRSETGGKHQPLEIGADRIARAAHEALTVIDELRTGSGLDLPMVWEPTFVGDGLIEVYPAATLRACGVSHKKYKEKVAVEVRLGLATCLMAQIDGLERVCDGSSDAFDAALCLVAAADFLLGRCQPPAPDEMDLAMKESWIWVRTRD